MCGPRQNMGCHGRRRRHHQGPIKTLVAHIIESHQEKKRLMAQSQQPQVEFQAPNSEPVAWRQTEREPETAAKYESRPVAWVDEKEHLRMGDDRVRREGSIRRIEVEGPPSYGEVMKGT